MKADILRRAEAISDSESEDDNRISAATDRGTVSKGRTVAFEEELDDDGSSISGTVKILGDGEESSAATDDEEGEHDLEPDAEEQRKPETILELAYIRDPGLFDRDAQTRRGKGRAELRGVTGMWDDIFMIFLSRCECSWN